MKVSIIGQGYVGLTIAMAATKFYEVVGFDNSESIIQSLAQGVSHIEGVSNNSISEGLRSGKYTPTANGADLRDSKVVVIAVPTPLNSERKPDFSYIEAACKTIGLYVKDKALIINESTSSPGTLRKIIKPTIESFSTNSVEHLYAISPERVDPGRADFTQKNTARIYSGLTSEAALLTREFYSKFCDNLISVSSPEVAEAAKLFENTFRQVNIALVNEFTQICHSLGINIYETLDAAASKPYGFMKFNPSAGVGGHCIPVDPTYLAEIAEAAGTEAKFIRLANDVNLKMPDYVVRRVELDFNLNLKDKKVIIIGVAYKPNVSDTRETPARRVKEILRQRGAKVIWHDNIVKKWDSETSSPIEKSDIAIVLTRHTGVSNDAILASAPLIFDTTGTVPGVRKL